MLPELCTYVSSKTSMSLCFKYVWIASCDLSLTLFPIAVYLLVFGSAPLGELVGRTVPAGKRACKGSKRNADAPEFPRGVCAPRESFYSLCAEVSAGESALPRRGRVGTARGGCPWECGDEACCEVLCICAPERLVEVRYAMVASDLSGWRGAHVDAVPCAVAIPVRCLVRFVPLRHARCGV